MSLWRRFWRKRISYTWAKETLLSYEASPALRSRVGRRFAFKNEGQNASASFKDRGMAGAFSYLRSLVRRHGWDEVLTVCASTGDTSAAAALYGSYVGAPIRTVVLLPQGKVTPQQLSQPLGNGALVLEVPGVFDDCAVEDRGIPGRPLSGGSAQLQKQLAHSRPGILCLRNRPVVRLGSGGQKSVCARGQRGQHHGHSVRSAQITPPGRTRFLPRLFGVQSEHADPVWRYYQAPADKRRFEPVAVRPSVAQQP